MLLLLLMLCQLLLSTLLLVLVIRYLFLSSSKYLFFENCDLLPPLTPPLFYCSILSWMSELELRSLRGNRLETSLARMEAVLMDNPDTVAAIQEAITRNRNTSNTINEREEVVEEERRWWRRRGE